jgi:carboxylate-amine ligase
LEKIILVKSYSNVPLTLGIEEEYQIIDPKSRKLHSYVQELLDEDKNSVEPLNIMPEFMQSQIESNSYVCRNVKEVRLELQRLRGSVSSLANKHGLEIVAASTHPFSKWREQSITEGDRYRELLDDLARIARSLLIFGCHVHVGFGKEKDLMIEIMNQARYFIPHVLALSSSSPFWVGELTGLKSYRSVIFEMLPRTGIPHSFSSFSEYQGFIKTLSNVGAFGKAETSGKLWWDIRPHHKFDTLEFRISDICTKIDEAVCIAALFQSICAKLIKLRSQNLSWRHYRHMHITENKFRAYRYGIRGEMIDFGREESVPFHFLAEELLEFLDDVLDDLDSRKEVEYVRTILKNGTSADRQIKAYHDAGGDENRQEALKAVVDQLIAETKEGI